MLFENVGRKRLTPKGSRATATVELDVPELNEGEGRLLDNGYIALNIPGTGMVVLRADAVHTFIPKTESVNPLDSLVKIDDSDDTEEAAEDEAAGKTEEPEALITKNEEPALKPSDLGSVTGGAGYGSDQSY